MLAPTVLTEIVHILSSPGCFTNTKPLRRSIEGFHMKIIMRRDCVIFHIENNTIDNAVKAVSFNLKIV